MLELDNQDIKLLDLLQKDASQSTAELADKLSISQSPAWRRVNRLEQSGLIKGRVAILDRKQLGLDLVVFTTINLSSIGRQNMQMFEEAVSKLDEVMECYTMTGAWDYMLKVVVKNITHYEQFVRNTLLELPMIGEIHSHIAVTEIKNSSKLPLATQMATSS